MIDPSCSSLNEESVSESDTGLQKINTNKKEVSSGSVSSGALSSAFDDPRGLVVALPATARRCEPA